MPNLKYFPRFIQDVFVFKVYENSPINTLIGTLTSVTSSESQVAYKLVSGALNENDMNDFRLDDQNGNLYVSNLLDREKYDSITLYASASYRDKNFRSDHALIQIQIVDTNDNAPLFTRPFYEYSIYANYELGSFLFRVEATDKDAGLNAQVKFKVGSKLNFQQLNLTLIASDCGSPVSQSTKSFILLKFINENYSPPFFDSDSNLTFEMFENQQIGTVIAQIYARDNEAGFDSDIVYKLLNFNNLFELKPSEKFIAEAHSFINNAKKTNAIHLFNLAEQSKGLNLTLSVSTDYEKDVSLSL